MALLKSTDIDRNSVLNREGEQIENSVTGEKGVLLSNRENDLQVRPQRRAMGSFATLPNWTDDASDKDEPRTPLGDLLSGRLADVDIDSVEAVRDERRRE